MDLRLGEESGDSGGGATFEQARKAAKATVEACHLACRRRAVGFGYCARRH